MEITNLKTHKCFEGTVQFWEHDSTSTKTKMKFSTFIPHGEVKGAIIWLSGLTCTDENFITKAGAFDALAKNNLMIICPDTSPRGLSLLNEHEHWDFGSGASFYLNAKTEGYKDHYNMENYVVNELTEILKVKFNINEKKISLTGHSMGGHGALTLGLNYPEKFASLSAFSPVSHPTKCPWGKKAFTGYLGTNESEWNRYDTTELLLSGKKHSFPILVDQGLSDDFLTGQLLVSDLEAAMKEMKQEGTVHFREGYDHSYYFIATFIKNHIEHHAQALK